MRGGSSDRAIASNVGTWLAEVDKVVVASPVHDCPVRVPSGPIVQRGRAQGVRTCGAWCVGEWRGMLWYGVVRCGVVWCDVEAQGFEGAYLNSKGRSLAATTQYVIHRAWCGQPQSK